MARNAGNRKMPGVGVLVVRCRAKKMRFGDRMMFQEFPLIRCVYDCFGKSNVPRSNSSEKVTAHDEISE